MSKRNGISTPMSLPSSGGGTSAVEMEFMEAVVACLAELKLLTVANNDATALAEIIGQLSALCDKLLLQGEQNEAICKKLETMLDQLAKLCEKIENGNEDILACLEDIKTALDDAIVALESIKESAEAICKKLEIANEALDAICEKLDKANESLSQICDKLEKLLSITEEFSQNNSEENAANLECLKDIKELLTCPVVTAKGVLTSWGN